MEDMDPTEEYVFQKRGLKSKNRSLLAAMTNKQSHEDGTLSDEEITWLTRRAKDGFGIVTTAASHVSELGKGWIGEMGVWSDNHIEGLTKLSTSLKQYGSLNLVQIFHGGMKAPFEINNVIPVCPSKMMIEATGKLLARSLENEEIYQLIEDFSDAAKRCEDAGFDGVEIHGAHSYLISQFLGLKTNRRKDEFGGSLENRFRFLKEIILSIRKKTSEDFLVAVRISPKINSIGINIEDSIEVTKMLCDMDIDMFHLSCWDAFEKLEGGQNLTNLFRPYVPENIAYTSTGAIWSTADAKWLMEQGADFVGVARVAIAHPNWAQGLSDTNYEPKRPPFTRDELLTADLSPVFVDYMCNWKGFVVK